MVAVFGADHIFRMNVRQMIRFHRERNADVTVAALPVPLDEASAFGVIAADQDGRITEFQEKPSTRPICQGITDHAFASMGNYLFKTDVLLQILQDTDEQGSTDFGQHLLPRMMRNGRMFAYNFASNKVPFDHPPRGLP